MTCVRSWAIAALMMLLAAVPAAAQQACPRNFEGQGAPITCLCSAQQAGTGTVWGTGLYTTDSGVCRAAVHTGAIPATGGAITVTPAAGMPAYVGSAANDVQTSNYGPWSASFTIAPPADSAALAACPANFEGQGGPLACRCEASTMGSAPVWGTGVYTTDSSVCRAAIHVCRAAIHAGAIPATGGDITVTPAPGMPAYIGSTSNSVQTQNYGPWARSFTIATLAPKSAQADGPSACPRNFEGRTAALSCLCEASAIGAVQVWGTGVYTTDSGVCRAAVHAGIIPATGGTVNVMPAPGLPSYQGSAANGVQTSPFGPWRESFTFRQ